MELKEGYKQTDVGVIPEHWETIELGQLLEFKNGLNKSKEHFGSGTTIINYLDVFKYPHLDATTVTGLVEVEKSEQLRYGVKDGDVLFTRTSETVDEIGMSTVVYNPPAGCVFSGFVLRGRFLGSKSQVSRQFLGWLLRSSSVRSQITETASYTTRALTNGKLLGKVIIQIPSFGEQEAIAEVLSDVDAEIELLARQYEKLINRKQGLSKELLSGRTRLVEPKSKGFKQTDVGVIPEDWEIFQLRHLLEIGHGRSQKEVEDKNGPYPIYGTGGLMGFATDYLHPGPTVMIGRKGTIDKPRFSEGPVWTVDTLFFCDCKKQLLPRFAFELFQTIDWRSYNEASGVPSLSSKTILSIEVVIPPLSEQQAIEEVLCDVDAEIQAVAKLKAKVQAKKEGLMQTLLTGKIRLI